MTVAAKRLQEAIRLCGEAVEVAGKAEKAKHRLSGSHFYAKKFHELEIALTVLRDELSTLLKPPPVSEADAKQFLSLVATVSSYVTPEEERRKALRQLRLLGEGKIILAVQRADEPEMPTSQEVLPLEVVANSRGYITSVVLQANGCYERGWHDAASVMIRKLIEILIIELYESAGRGSFIQKKGSRDFMLLGELIETLLSDPGWNLARETKAVLPKIKLLGDQAAHNRRFIAKKPDVEKVIPGLRVAVEDLLHLSRLK